MRKSNLTADGRTVTVRVPISIRRRGGRKLLVAPDAGRHPSGAKCWRTVTT